MSATTPFDCPRCGIGLAMSDRQGIEIDYCPQCRGVWLDRGELDKIIERAGAPPAMPGPSTSSWAGQGGGGWPQPAPQQQPWRDNRYQHGQKRRKSWLEEIFD